MAIMRRLYLVNLRFIVTSLILNEQLIINLKSPILSEKNIQIEPGQLVFLPAKFISDLSIIIEPLRPVPRLGKIIPPGDR